MRDLSDLINAEYDACLARVHEYYEKHADQRALLKPNKGPVNSSARRQPGAERKVELEDYNGEGGGQVFRWYHKAIFEMHLKKLGADGLLAANEKQVMAALRLTSEDLHSGMVNGRRLLEYAGPQCFPQVREHAERQPELVCASVQELDQYRDCWLNCESCKKFRLVRRDCMPAVCPDMFKGSALCPDDVDWKAWMRNAEERYQAYVHVQKPNVGDEAEVGEIADAADKEGGEEARDLGEFFASDSEASVDYPLEREMDQVKSLVGSYAGPKTVQDKADEKEAARAEGVVWSGADLRIRFDCSMLQRLECAGDVRTWKTMSCQDKDDLTGLHEMPVPVGAVADGARVVILKKDAKDVGFVRAAEVSVGWK